MSFGILSPKVDFVFKKIFGNEKHPNILISFLNAVIKPTDLIKSVQIKNKYLKNDNFDNCYRLKEKNTNEELTDVMELHFIEIPKLRKLENSEDISDMLEAWITFIESPTSELIDKLEMSSEEIKEAKEELLRLSGNDKERERYEKRFESLLEQNSLLANAERKGLQKGIQKGLKEGENRKAIEIAKKAIDNNLDDSTIKIITGLSLEEIKELKTKR